MKVQPHGALRYIGMRAGVPDGRTQQTMPKLAAARPSDPEIVEGEVDLLRGEVDAMREEAEEQERTIERLRAAIEHVAAIVSAPERYAYAEEFLHGR